jgi:hypothetical protein
MDPQDTLCQMSMNLLDAVNRHEHDYRQDTELGLCKVNVRRIFVGATESRSSEQVEN